MVEFLILILAIPVGAAAIDFLLSHSILGRGYRIFVAPGVIVHELSHSLACLITGAKVKRISLFAKSGGSVEHEQSRLPVVGQLLISLAPFISGVALIYILSKFIGLKEINIMSLSPTLEEVRNLAINVWSNFRVDDKISWLLLYITLSIAVTMNPSWQDIKNIGFLGIVLVGAGYLTYRFSSFRPSLNLAIPDQVIAVVSTVDFLLILCLFLSIIIFTVSKLVKPV